ncbi:MAG: regulatory iron-sulfur-containing complex subunit RicT [bacterium]
MYEVVGVKFKEEEKVFYCNTFGIELKLGEYCVVEVNQEKELGKVVIAGKIIMEDEIIDVLPIIRKALPEDMQRKEEIEEKEKKYFALCQKNIKEMNFPIKLIKARYSFDKEKIIFFFITISEEKVDFSNLIKNLVYYLRAKVEFKQINIRDESKFVGGYGVCGKSLCCTIFKEKFKSISVKFAKEQNIAINTEKTKGCCGRLKCCLAYEYDFYKEENKKYPKKGEIVSTAEITGEVIDYNILKGMVKIRDKDDKKIEIKLEDIKK